LRERVADLLDSLLRGRDAFIVGSSLTDPPLLDALHRTRDVGRRRIALTATPGYGVESLDSDEVDLLKDALSDRMQEYGVELYFPDFYYQVPQFVREVTMAALLSSIGRYDQDSGTELRYDKRLEEWWTRWEATHSSVPNASQKAHDLAAAGLRELSVDLLPLKRDRQKRDEAFKLEVWLRWEPSRENRDLALWSHSDSVNANFRTPKRISMRNSEQSVAMQAFLHGKPILSDEAAGTTLAVPVSVELGLQWVPVGVVTLSSPERRDVSRIFDTDNMAMHGRVTGLRTVGERLLTPQR
jgi:hypothetical protein